MGLIETDKSEPAEIAFFLGLKDADKLKKSSFDLENISEKDCDNLFCFTKDDIPRLCRALRVLDKI